MKKICMRYLGKGKIMDQWIRKTDAADHMKEVTNNGVTYLTFPALDATGIVTHHADGRCQRRLVFDHEFLFHTR